VTWSSLPARDLDPPELRTLVDELAAHPELWEEHVAFAGDTRHYVSLRRDDHVDVWLLCWTTESDTGWHDHDVSSGAVHVVDGALVESAPRIGGEPAERVVRAGTSFAFGPDRIHRLSGEDAQSVSLHAYSPPLWRLGQYAIDDDGLMRRHSISYADELRPLAGAAA
jgi:hypothetical protein